MKSMLSKLYRPIISILVILAIIWLVKNLWTTYVASPWTRDGRVSVHVSHLAPEVSGPVLKLNIKDNQFVKQGQVLYVIDPERFELDVARAKTQLMIAQQSMKQKQEEAVRRTGLDDIVPKEDIQRAARAATIASSEVQRAEVQLKEAQLNLNKTKIKAPVDGYITHLQLHQGDYAVSGQSNVAIVDSKSFWITGYFEETKLKEIAVNAPVQIKLMGDQRVITGHVVSIGRGIADENESADHQGLPSVNPTFSWVRLAQRIPVRIEIDHIPEGVQLSAGMTCSVDVGTPGEPHKPQGRLLTALRSIM